MVVCMGIMTSCKKYSEDDVKKALTELVNEAKSEKGKVQVEDGLEYTITDARFEGKNVTVGFKLGIDISQLSSSDLAEFRNYMESNKAEVSKTMVSGMRTTRDKGEAKLLFESMEEYGYHIIIKMMDIEGNEFYKLVIDNKETQKAIEESV